VLVVYDVLSQRQRFAVERNGIYPLLGCAGLCHRWLAVLGRGLQKTEERRIRNPDRSGRPIDNPRTIPAGLIAKAW